MTTTTPPPRGRDRLRELLEAVLAEEHGDLEEMAGGAHASAYHFSRQLTRHAGEPPVSMRRRVLLERAAWRLRGGATVTEVALEAGYESVEGFSRAFARAFGHPPSRAADSGAGHWLPAPNGIHFHPPTSLWVEERPAGGSGGGRVLGEAVLHDVEDTREVLALVADLPEDDVRRPLLPGHVTLAWDGAEESLLAVLDATVWTKEVWVAAMTGAEMPDRPDAARASLPARHERAAAAWLAVVRDVERRDAWRDRLVDALCEPPQSFVVGGVVQHVLTFAAHRRLLARAMLRMLGHEGGSGDPLDWQLRRSGGQGAS